jgi:hypothetical protein
LSLDSPVEFGALPRGRHLALAAQGLPSLRIGIDDRRPLRMPREV